MKMGELTENEEKLWKQMLFLWERLNVPAVKTKKFQVGKYKVRSPWFSLKENIQISLDTKSLDRTAKHLAVDFADKEEELIAAYKIYGYLKTHYGEPTPFSRILINVMQKHDVYEGNLWFASAKWVIPKATVEDLYQYEHEIENKDWIKTVLAAAEYWIKLAEEWEILIIPEYTERDSDLNQQLEKFTNLWHTNEEFKNFILLRDKLKRTLDEDAIKFLMNDQERVSESVSRLPKEPSKGF